MSVMLLTELHMEFQGLKGGGTGSSHMSRLIYNQSEHSLSYDVTSESEITQCNKICKPLVVYRFSGNVMTSITTLRTVMTKL